MMKRLFCTGLALQICCLSTLPRLSLAASTITPQAALARLLTAPRIQAAWFSPGMLAQVPLIQLQGIVNSVKADLGAFTSVRPQGTMTYLLNFTRGTDPAQIAVDSTGRITNLFFHTPRFTNLAAALGVVANLPGQASLLVTQNGAAKAAYHESLPLAVGPGFRLAVLAAVQRAVRDKHLSWERMHTLRAQDFSLPSGILTSQPIGSRYSVRSLASLMISASDNTATDILIRLLGRAAIDPLLPARDRPTMTTYEEFVLQNPSARDLREHYLNGSQAQRLAALDQADRLPLPLPMWLYNTRGALAEPRIGYFLSARELCRLVAQVALVPPMGENPGFADPRAWRHVAFINASAPGISSATTLLTARDGRSYCVSATWNNTAALSDSQFSFLYGGVIGTLQ